MRILVNEASRIERSAQRVDCANGYKPKTALARLGEVTFEVPQVPQVRSGGFYPNALERGSPGGQAMNLALAELYVQGLSTRKSITVLQKLVGPDIAISFAQISCCMALLDEGLQAWRSCPLNETWCEILDARPERVCHASRVCRGSVVSFTWLSPRLWLRQSA